jgi:hypothetical protein
MGFRRDRREAVFLIQERATRANFILVETELVNDPIKPIIGCVTRWLGRQRVLTTTIRWRDCKIMALGSHASDYVLTSRVVYVDSTIPLVKMIGFCPASSHIFGLVRQTTSQSNPRQQNDCSSHLVRCSATIAALVNRNVPAHRCANSTTVPLLGTTNGLDALK